MKWIAMGIGVALLLGCCLANAQTTKTIIMRDACDPDSFNATVGPGTCVAGQHGTTLFGDFIGTAGLSDFPWSSITGSRPWTSRCAPPLSRRRTRGSPGSRAWSFRTCVGSSTARGRPGTRDGAPGRAAFRFG